MSRGKPTLGCDPIYNVYITDSCSSSPLRTVPKVCKIKFNRVVDDISDAKISFGLNDVKGCTDFADFLCLGRHYVVIERDGCVEWKGPTRRIEFADDQINLFASDPLWWATRRVIPTFYYSTVLDGIAVSYSNPAKYFEDRVLRVLFGGSMDDYIDTYSSEIGLRYDTCVEDFQAVCFDKVFASTGLLSEDIDVLYDSSLDFFSLWDVMEDLGKSVIDFTVVGEEFLYGWPTPPVPSHRQQPRPLLTAASWCSPPRIVKDISNVVNDVIVESSLPPQDAYDDPTLEDRIYQDGSLRYNSCWLKHGFHQKVTNLRNATSFDEIDAAARGLVDYNQSSSSVVYLENTNSTRLSADVLWDLPRMIPGMIVDVDLCVYGVNIQDQLRLNEVVVEWSPGDEKVKGSFEPVGVA